jgi:hypothetical protein
VAVGNTNPADHPDYAAASLTADNNARNLEPLFTCQACGLKGAEVRADLNWAVKQNKPGRGELPGFVYDSVTVMPQRGCDLSVSPRSVCS